MVQKLGTQIIFFLQYIFYSLLPHISSPSLLQLYCLYFEHNLCDKWNDVIAKKNHYNSKSFFIFFPIPKMRDSFLYQLLKFYSAHNKLKISLNIQAQEQASSDKKNQRRFALDTLCGVRLIHGNDNSALYLVISMTPRSRMMIWWHDKTSKIAKKYSQNPTQKCFTKSWKNNIKFLCEKPL